jgi:DNA-binding Lrp family transcriptional regulator
MTEAFIFVNCFLAMAGAVENMAKITEGVSGAYVTTGIYDLILKIQVQDDKLRDVIQKIKSIPGVASLMTSIILK